MDPVNQRISFQIPNIEILSNIGSDAKNEKHGQKFPIRIPKFLIRAIWTPKVPL
jgi:hypothetical protein